MVYSMTNRQEIAGPLAALYVHLGTCCYSSANCSKLPFGDMIRQLYSNEEYQCQLVIGSDGSGGPRSKATAVSVLDDYIFRPKELGNRNVYEFAMKYYRRQSEEPTLSRFPFKNGHPLFRTHCLGVRVSDTVPLITGYKIPGIVSDATNEDKLKHAIGSLVLFKSFRSIVELTGRSRPSDETWLDAYDAWESQRSDFVVEIMRNMHDFTFARSKATAAALNHQFGWSQKKEDTSSTSSKNSDQEAVQFDDYEIHDTGEEDGCLDKVSEQLMECEVKHKEAIAKCHLNGEREREAIRTACEKKREEVRTNFEKLLARHKLMDTGVPKDVVDAMIPL